MFFSTDGSLPVGNIRFRFRSSESRVTRRFRLLRIFLWLVKCFPLYLGHRRWHNQFQLLPFRFSFLPSDRSQSQSPIPHRRLWKVVRIDGVLLRRPSWETMSYTLSEPSLTYAGPFLFLLWNRRIEKSNGIVRISDIHGTITWRLL